MEVTLKIAGKNLLAFLSRETAGHKNISLIKTFDHEDIGWRFERLPDNHLPQELLCCPDSPAVLVIEANDCAVIRKIEMMEKQATLYMQNHPDVALALSPVVLVFQSPAVLAEIRDLPDSVSSWTYMPVTLTDLVHRILFSLKKKNMLKKQLRIGQITLIPDSRSVACGKKIARLTPSEFTLAELFLSHMGTVIPLKDLIRFFSSRGKSTAPNNIRVAIHQLRLKLEMLTRSQVSVDSVYRKGYCLRQKQTQEARYSRTTGSAKINPTECATLIG